MNDRNLFRLAMLAAAFFVAVEASPADAALPLTGAGMPDPTFGTGNGEVTTLAAKDLFPYGAALQADGKLVVSASIDGGQDIYSFALARYLENGALDPSFANGGIGVYPMSPNDGPGLNGVVTDPSGRMFIVGFTQPDEKYRCSLLAVRSDGVIDATFAKGGLFEFQPTPGKSAQCSTAIVQSDGKIVAFGYQALAHNEAFVIRLLPDGRFDESFNGNGVVALASPNGFTARTIIAGSDGSMFVTGSTDVKPRIGIVAKLRADGTPDPSFGAGGRFETNVPGGGSVDLYSAALQADGKLVAVGAHGDGAFTSVIVRVSASGIPDAGFGAGGVIDHAVGGYPGFTRGIAIQKDGKYVLESRVVAAGGKVRFAVERMLPSGTLDATFANGGVAVLAPFATGGDYSNGMAIAADGKIWVSGDSTNASNRNMIVVARLLGDEVRTPIVEFHNGTLDHYFITADPNEAAAIDAGGAGPGWVRTGQQFKSGGPSRVCRFYGSPETDPSTGKRRGPNGHFYTISQDECAQVKEDAGWRFEGYDFNGWPLQAGGQCPDGTVPVKRAYNNRFATNDSNHRFASTDTIYNQMLAQGWSGEGAVFCAIPMPF